MDGTTTAIVVGPAATAVSRPAYLLLALVCLAMYLPGLWSLPPIDRDEARFAQATRQMLESGDLVDIRFQDQPRYNKPAGIYWLQAASVVATGTADERVIWPHRLPSVLGAVLAVLGTAWIGAQLLGGTAGTVAGLVLAGTFLLGFEAREARADAVLLATVVAAQGLLAQLYLAGAPEPGARPAAPWLLWLVLGASILIKGPIILLTAGGTILGLAAADRERGWLRRLRPWPGVLATAAVAAPWAIAIAIVSDGSFFANSLGRDLLAKVAQGQESHWGPPGYHVLSWALAFWPFAPLLVLAAPAVWRGRRDKAVRFCLAWLLPTLLVFELVATKLPHYTLPIYPALALLVAATMPAAGRLTHWVGLGVLAVGTAAWAGALAALPWLLEGALDPVALAAAAAIVVLMAAAAWSWQARRRRAALAAALAAAWVLQAAALERVLPGAEALWLSPRLVEAAAGSCRLIAAGYSEPSLVFLAGTDTVLGQGQAAAEQLLRQPCAIAAVEERQRAAFLERLAAQGVAPTAVAEIAGFQYARGDEARLTLYRLE